MFQALGIVFVIVLLAGAATVSVVVVRRNREDVETSPPSITPSSLPSFTPSLVPSTFPSSLPTLSPSQVPSLRPSTSPSDFPSVTPTTSLPSSIPSTNPSNIASSLPTNVASSLPTLTQTGFSTTSFVPTLSLPDEILIPANQDTFIYGSEALPSVRFESQGRSETLLVQKGVPGVREVPDTWILMTFDFSCCGLPSFRPGAANSWTVTLILEHVPAVLERGPATYTIVRLESTPLIIEALHGGSSILGSGVDGPTVQVSPTDTTKEIDITELVQSAFPLDMDQLYLQIENRGEPQVVQGDYFYSRESDSPPLIRIETSSGITL